MYKDDLKQYDTAKRKKRDFEQKRECLIVAELNVMLTGNISVFYLFSSSGQNALQRHILKRKY